MSGAGSDARRRKAAGASSKASAKSSARFARVAIPIDAVADAAIAARGLAAAIEGELQRCHVCESAVAPEDLSRGLLVWSRGDEIRLEEPALCKDCSAVLGISALAQWRREEDDEE